MYILLVFSKVFAARTSGWFIIYDYAHKSSSIMLSHRRGKRNWHSFKKTLRNSCTFQKVWYSRGRGSPGWKVPLRRLAPHLLDPPPDAWCVTGGPSSSSALLPKTFQTAIQKKLETPQSHFVSSSAPSWPKVAQSLVNALWKWLCLRMQQRAINSYRLVISLLGWQRTCALLEFYEAPGNWHFQPRQKGGKGGLKSQFYQM